MEALDWLADGDDGVRLGGASEYFEQFFDIIDDAGKWRSSNCLSPEEMAGLDAVVDIVTAACDDTPTRLSDDDLVGSGWPSRITPIASKALSLMRRRGRFREDAEEDEPSLPG